MSVRHQLLGAEDIRLFCFRGTSAGTISCPTREGMSRAHIPLHWVERQRHKRRILFEHEKIAFRQRCIEKRSHMFPMITATRTTP